MYLFSPASVTFSGLVRGVSTCFVWRIYCLFALCLCSWSLWPECFQQICTLTVFKSWSVTILVLLESFGSELSIISSDDGWIEKPWITGSNPHPRPHTTQFWDSATETGGKICSSLLWSSQSSSTRDARRTNETFWTLPRHSMLQAHTFVLTVVKLSFFLSFCTKEWVILLFSLIGRGRVGLSYIFAFLKSFCERLPQAIIVFLFYSFRDNDRSKKEPPIRTINWTTNTFKVYFIYKCVYVCLKYIRTIAYIFMYMSEEVCGLICLLGDALFFLYMPHECFYKWLNLRIL